MTMLGNALFMRRSIATCGGFAKKRPFCYNRSVNAIPFFVFFLGVGMAWSMPAGAPQFLANEPLPSVGLELPMMSHATQDPVQPPSVLRYRFRQGDREWTEDRSPMAELWRSAQTVGIWTDRKGNRMELGLARFALPPALADQDVAQDTFERVASDETYAITEKSSPSELAVWMGHFAGCAIADEPRRMPVNQMRLSAVWEFPMADPAVRAYAFRLNPQHAGQAKARKEWFALVVRLVEPPRANDPDWDRRLRTDVLANIRFTGLYEHNRFETDKAKRRVRASGAPTELLEDDERLRARASVEHLDDWWYMDSEHYVLLSDDPGAEGSADRILGAVEAMRPRYEALVPRFRKTIDATGVIRLFRRGPDFERYLTDGSRDAGLGVSRTAGIFDGRRRELIVRPVEKGSLGDVAGILRHEAFHQYLFSAWGGIEASPWFNEGSAEVFETYQPSGSKWSAPENETYAAFLEQVARGSDDWLAPVLSMLFQDHDGFYSTENVSFRSGSRIYSIHPGYAFAYGIMEFLYFGAPSVRGRPYKNILPTYFEELERTRDPVAATLAAFQMGPDGRKQDFVKRFADDLRTFWKAESARKEARKARIP